MSFTSPSRALLAALSLALVPLAAGESEAPVYGFQVGSVLTNGDLRSLGAKSGPTAGFQAVVDLGGGHAIRPRADWTQLIHDYFKSGLVFTGVDPTQVQTDGNFAIQSLSMGADYLYHLDAERKGLYVFAGAGLSRHRLKGSGDLHLNGDRVWTYAFHDAVYRPYAQVGVGYQLREHLSLEVRHRISQTPTTRVAAAETTLGQPFTGTVQLGSLRLRTTEVGVTVRF